MKHDLVTLIVELRFLIGFLGEKSQNNWWGSNFIGPSSEAFLVPVYSRTSMLAQYHGVCEAALLVHDDPIGVGANYHLYRLPDSIEQSAAKAILENGIKEQVKSVLVSSDVALRRLRELCSGEVEQAEGPIVVGSFSDSDLENLLHKSASHYFKAFSENYKCFPYMREA